MEYKEEIRNCQNCKNDFTIEPEDFLFYEKIKVPPPTFCHYCRLQRKLSWRNERTLYKRNCNNCGDSIISVFSENKPFPIFCSKCYHGDNWDPLSFGLEIDFSRNFLEQFHNLQKITPRQYALAFNNVNSAYTNAAGFNKNCYLIFVSDHNEDCFYSYNIYHCKNSLDLSTCFNCEYCYDLLNCSNCRNVFYSIDCKDSYGIYFSKDCINCHDVIGSIGLRNKSYYIFNEPYTKEEYKEIVNKLKLNNYSSIVDNLKKTAVLFKKYPVKYFHGNNNVDFSGDNISNSKNTHHAFSSKEMEDCKYIINGNKSKDCYECYVAVDKSEMCFDCLGCYNTRNTLASHLPWDSYDLNYCDGCESCSNCFGCVSLVKQEYCILNKKYEKDDYFKLKEKIIKQMIDKPFVDNNGRLYSFGEFFPIEMSPYCYNETVANLYFPLIKEDALKQGYSWQDELSRNYSIQIKSDQIPDDIENVDDSITNMIIECEHLGECKEQCTKAFKITEDEFNLYKLLKLPIPRQCHNCRYYQRLKLENPKKLWHRSCMKEGCTNEFETSYSPERPEIVYCEKCYQQEVY